MINVEPDKLARKDPIADAPLRDPGQSLREEIQDRSLDVIVPWLAVAVLSFATAMIEWIRSFTNALYIPWQMTAFAVMIAIIAAWRIRCAGAELFQWKMGLKRERAVGQYLRAMLLARGYYVFTTSASTNLISIARRGLPCIGRGACTLCSGSVRKLRPPHIVMVRNL